MPQPTKSAVHVNRPLTNISIAYIQRQTNYVADKVFPNVPVAKQSDRYFVYSKADWLRDEAQERAPSSESSGSGWDIDNTPTYFCKVWAHHKDIDDQIRANADEPIDMDRDATQFVSDKLLLKREKQFVANYMTTSVWTGAADFTPGTLWSAANSTPIEDVETKRTAIKQSTGYDPNTLVVCRDVFACLKNHSTILERIKYTQKGIVTADLLAAIFGVDNFLVLDAIENTAVKGATGAYSFLGLKDALLVYSNPSPSLLTPSGGYTFSWKGYNGVGNNLGMSMSKFRMDNIKSDRVEGEMAFDMKLVGSDMGCFFSNVIS